MLGKKLLSFIKRLFVSIGLGTVVTLIFALEPIYYWTKNPHLEVQYRNSWVRLDAAAIIPMAISVNIEPHVRFHMGQYPPNQVKNISVKKGDLYLPFRTDPEIPFVVHDEPVAVDISVLSLSLEETRGKPVEVSILDRWGNVSKIEIQAP